MREFTVFAPAKLNLYLDVLSRRPDGYHNIKTLFEKIDIKDEIIVKEKKSHIDVKPIPSLCPSGRDNIIYKALERLLEIVDVKLGLEIVIKKNIPVSAGLGGGSSDAASILRSVNEKFDLGVPFEKLFSIAAEIGKDVPFFMLDAPFAIGSGTGELLEPIYLAHTFSHIVIKPNISISTMDMYRRLDKLGHRSKDFDIKEIVSALEINDITLLDKFYYNIFEEILEDYRSYIDEAKSLLTDTGCRTCFMSGSGPSVFCTTKNRGEAMRILDRIPKGKGMEVFLAATYKGGIYGDK